MSDEKIQVSAKDLNDISGLLFILRGKLALGDLGDGYEILSDVQDRITYMHLDMIVEGEGTTY